MEGLSFILFTLLVVNIVLSESNQAGVAKVACSTLCLLAQTMPAQLGACCKNLVAASK